MPKLASSPILLGLATVLASVSFFFHVVIPRSFLYQEALWWVPIVLGGMCVWLGYSAWRVARYRRFTIIYMVLLTPFAFSYPGWVLVLFLMLASGTYHGPMP